MKCGNTKCEWWVSKHCKFYNQNGIRCFMWSKQKKDGIK